MPRINSLNTFVLSTIINSVGGGGGEPEQANYQGATMVFVLNGTAPTGWVKDTSDNDYTLRCVTGSVLTGGTTAFSTVMASRSIVGSVPVTGSSGPNTINTALMGTHDHPVPSTSPFIVSQVTTAIAQATAGITAGVSPTMQSGTMAASPTTPGTAGGTAHAHPLGPGLTTPTTLGTLNMTVKYVETILATRT